MMRAVSVDAPCQGLLEEYFDRLWPLHRSLAGPGFNRSLEILADIMPHERLLYPSGSQVLDWKVPPEWHPHQAYITAPDGRRIADISVNNLHLVSYSMPVSGCFSFEQLKKHLHTRPDKPQAIPYVTSYYKPDWGFCISQEMFDSLPDGNYEVLIDTEFKEGNVVVAEAVLPGRTSDEILFSSYLCHPSMANNELTGPLALTFLYRHLAELKDRQFTYRFLLLPETIGSLCYLSSHGEHFRKHLKGGIVLTCLGGRGHPTYKLSRQANSLIDRAVKAVFRGQGFEQIVPFNPADGSDERQYCSPGFNLPVGSLSRTLYGQYPEYHTSLDNKSAIDFSLIEDSIALLKTIVLSIENNHYPINRYPYGEPQLGRRFLYPQLSKATELDFFYKAIMWVLNLGDGSHDLLSIAEQSCLPPDILIQAVSALRQADVIE